MSVELVRVMDSGLEHPLYAFQVKTYENKNNYIVAFSEDSSTSLPPTPPSQSCGDPGTPANGIKIGSDYSVGSVVYYECEPGFKLLGPKSRLCRFDGHWSEELPTCVGNGRKYTKEKNDIFLLMLFVHRMCWK